MEAHRPAEDQVHIRFRLERDEYVRGVRFYLRKSHLVSWVQGVVILAALAAVAFLVWLIGRLNFLTTLLLVLTVMAAGYGAFLYFIQPGRLFQKEPKLSEEVSFVFSREDIARQDAEAALIYDWSIQKLWRGREFYYLFTEQDGYTMLPFRAFPTQEDRRLFEALARDADPDMIFKTYS